MPCTKNYSYFFHRRTSVLSLLASVQTLLCAATSPPVTILRCRGFQKMVRHNNFWGEGYRKTDTYQSNGTIEEPEDRISSILRSKKQSPEISFILYLGSFTRPIPLFGCARCFFLSLYSASFPPKPPPISSSGRWTAAGGGGFRRRLPTCHRR